MINGEQRQLLHEYLILDLAIRSLQQDYQALERLKMKNVFIEMIDQLLKNLRTDFYNRKRVLAKKKISIVRWVRIDEYFSDVIIGTAGNDITLRYAKLAIKKDVEQLIKYHLYK